jgi:DNA-binding MarR family transcriptional regulator
MKIEEAIQQKKFKDERTKAGINLIYTANWLQAIFKQQFEAFAISPQQFNVLRILRGQYPNAISTCDIRSRMLDKMSDVSRIVARLNTTGYVQQKSNVSDKRLVDVTISNAGLKLLDSMDAAIEASASPLSGLTIAEAKTLNGLLDKLRSKAT